MAKERLISDFRTGAEQCCMVWVQSGCRTGAEGCGIRSVGNPLLVFLSELLVFSEQKREIAIRSLLLFCKEQRE